MKVFISTTTFGEHSEKPLELLKEKGFEYDLNPHGRKLTEEEITDILRSGTYSGIIAGTEPLTGAVLEKADGLKVISRVGVGLDNVDMAAAEKLEIKVRNTPSVLIDSVAEMTLGLILASLRRIASMDRNLRKGTWKKEMGTLFTGKTLGIIGLGQIGTRVAELAKTFGAEVIFSDLNDIKTQDYRQVSIDELLQSSDIISVHLSSKEELISEKEISKMKDGVILVNTARGGVISEDALYEGLSSGKIAHAALDVYGAEPYSGKLTELENITLTPHAGSYAKEARITMELEAVKNLVEEFGV
ncbi:MAG: phosphoglycerate dehydrogenase [Candidatus Omnitrophota bacterium]